MSEQPASAPAKRRKRLRWVLGIGFLLLALLIAFGPSVVGHTGLRNVLIDTVLASPDVSGSAEDASFGWLSPLAIEEFSLESKHKRVQIQVKAITTDRAWWQLLHTSPELGTITFDRPRITVELPLVEKVPADRKKLGATLAAVVRDGALLVRVADLEEPVIDVDGINLTVRIEKTETGRQLVLEPMQVLHRQKLTRKLCDDLLQLFDPTLADVVTANGEISLSLDRFKIPLDIPREQLAEKIEIAGKLELHRVRTGVKTPLLRALVKILADLYDKRPSRIVELVEDAEVRFEVRQGRIHHEGLRFGFPEISPDLVIQSSGSVGVDESLDLQLKVPRLLAQDQPPLDVQITGTINEPRVEVRGASLTVRVPELEEPLVDLDLGDRPLTFHIKNVKSGKQLTMEPLTLFENQEITPELGGNLLRQLDPTLARQVRVQGKVSLSLEKLQIPLGGSKKQFAEGIELAGTLGLHQIHTEVNTPLLRGIAKVLADLYDRKPSEIVRVVEDARVRFGVRNGRLYHEGMRFAFPDISPDLVVRSSGSVGLDQSLDLLLEVPRLLSREASPLEVRITGTVSRPRVEVRGGALTVRVPELDKPLLDLHDLHLIFWIESNDSGTHLTLEPLVLFDKQKLTPELGTALLRRVNPSLADVARVEGELSLAVDKMRIPLGASKEQLANGIEVAGRLQLHQINTEVKTPLLQGMVKVLADLYHKKPSEIVRVVEDAEVRFQVRAGRIYHEGLNFGFPDISPELVARSTGSIGFDETLDLHLEVPRVLVKEATPANSATTPVRFHITGTVSKPVVTEKKNP
jgi:hypothetical protein